MSTFSAEKPETVNVTFKTKWLWLVLGVILIIISLAPVVSSYFPSTPAVPSSPSSGGGGGGGPTPNCANPCTIVIANSAFGTTQPIIVKAGTTVTWINKDNTQHTTTSDTGVWDSGILNPGQSFKFTFSSPGTYPYHCNVHPMSGTIVVVP
jgi:hypothetical protein